VRNRNTLGEQLSGFPGLDDHLGMAGMRVDAALQEVRRWKCIGELFGFPGGNGTEWRE